MELAETLYKLGWPWLIFGGVSLATISYKYKRRTHNEFEYIVFIVSTSTACVLLAPLIHKYIFPLLKTSTGNGDINNMIAMVGLIVALISGFILIYANKIISEASEVKKEVENILSIFDTNFGGKPFIVIQMTIFSRIQKEIADISKRMKFYPKYKIQRKTEKLAALTQIGQIFSTSDIHVVQQHLEKLQETPFCPYLDDTMETYLKALRDYYKENQSFVASVSTVLSKAQNSP